MTFDADDLLGDEPTPKKTKRPVPDEELDDRDDTFDAKDPGPTIRGVNVSWLVSAFRMDRQTIKNKLGHIRPLKMEGGARPVYDFVHACECLVKPRMDFEAYIKKMRPEDLPADLQKEYWDARLKRQKFMLQAGELWHTDDVIDVFGEAFKHIKTSTQLWVSQLDRATGLSPEQLKMLDTLTGQLLADMNERLIAMKKAASTTSTAADEEDDDVSDS